MNEQPLRVAVLASGSGTNLQAILDRLHGRGVVEVVAVGSDRPEARALARAADAGIATRSFTVDEQGEREQRDLAIADWLGELRAELVVLAGYMQLLCPSFIERFAGRIINVHPALLPSFPGLDAIGQAYRHGVRFSGVTVHFVDAGVDTGPSFEPSRPRQVGAIGTRHSSAPLSAASAATTSRVPSENITMT